MDETLIFLIDFFLYLNRVLLSAEYRPQCQIACSLICVASNCAYPTYGNADGRKEWLVAFAVELTL